MKSVKTKKLIEKIEGEAELDFTLEKGKVKDVRISFGFYRGIEEILRGKSAWDALVITPRVCGICNHAHLITAVRAIEDGYRNVGVEVTLSDKAKAIREFTLACELIQNHIKWFYMTILPQMESYLDVSEGENHALKASYLSSTITKALAIFAGQWPHSSYAIPGGVSCDPTHLDVMQAGSLVDEVIRFVENVVIGIPLESLLVMDSVTQMHKIGGDLGRVMHLIGSSGMSQAGQSHDRFIVFGASPLSPAGKSIATKISNVDVRYVMEEIQEGTVAKAVLYKERLYETGPLARAMLAKRPIVKSLHKRYKDSILTRIFARVYEVAVLLDQCRDTLKTLQLDEPSCTLVDVHKDLSFDGVGIVEAARGSLIHTTKVERGIIQDYQIITPTQWNLSNGTKEEIGVAIRGMVGATSKAEAELIFRTFDICSVCTAQ